MRKTVTGGDDILYINKYYEKNLTTGNITTSYYLSSRLVATCENSTLRYVHQDHLSGTSLMTDDEGNEISGINYYPFGLTRTGDVPTDRKFTGQRLDDTGLYYYGARYYDPEIGRFISADTIIPDPTNPQAYNRYTYCLNNPLKYVDPSGNIVKIGDAISYSYSQGGGAFIETKHRNPTNDETKLINSWQIFKATMPDVAKEMEQSDIEYSIRWSPPILGSTTVGNNGDQTMFISQDRKNLNEKQIAASIAHETYHAQEGKQSNSIFEEVGANQREYAYRISVGLPLDRDSRYCKDVNLDPNNPNLDNVLKDVRNKWDQNRTSPQSNMYADLPLLPVQGGWEETMNVFDMLWSMFSYYLPNGQIYNYY